MFLLWLLLLSLKRSGFDNCFNPLYWGVLIVTFCSGLRRRISLYVSILFTEVFLLWPSYKMGKVRRISEVSILFTEVFLLWRQSKAVERNDLMVSILFTEVFLLWRQAAFNSLTMESVSILFTEVFLLWQLWSFPDPSRAYSRFNPLYRGVLIVTSDPGSGVMSASALLRFNPLYRGVLIVTGANGAWRLLNHTRFNPLYWGVLIVTAGAEFLDGLGLLRRFANISSI